MIRAYAEEYLTDAMKNLGEAFDYATNSCGIPIETFTELFIASGFAEQFGRGVPKVLGLTGTELVMEVVGKSGAKYTLAEPQTEFEYSPEYWCGYVLAYYQWHTGKSFKDIDEVLPIREVLKLYPTLHETAEEKFIDTADAIIKRNGGSTRLQRRRKKCGLTQKALAEKSGVNLRSLQQYEMRAKDINRASASALAALASALGCRIEDLLE